MAREPGVHAGAGRDGEPGVRERLQVQLERADGHEYLLPELGVPGQQVRVIERRAVFGECGLGAHDAGQSWHTDMTYSQTMGFVNVLSAFKVPARGGRVLGGTEFTNTQAAAAHFVFIGRADAA